MGRRFVLPVGPTPQDGVVFVVRQIDPALVVRSQPVGSEPVFPKSSTAFATSSSGAVSLGSASVLTRYRCRPD
jgi:hypothetical protein